MIKHVPGHSIWLRHPSNSHLQYILPHIGHPIPPHHCDLLCQCIAINSPEFISAKFIMSTFDLWPTVHSHVTHSNIPSTSTSADYALQSNRFVASFQKWVPGWCAHQIFPHRFRSLNFALGLTFKFIKPQPTIPSSPQALTISTSLFCSCGCSFKFSRLSAYNKNLSWLRSILYFTYPSNSTLPSRNLEFNGRTLYGNFGI